MSARSRRIIMALVVLAYLVGMTTLSRTRPLDGDEGYYASAARLVVEGKTPYLDFFYPQMPLVPYLYAPLYQAVGSSLMSLRLGSVFLGGLSLLAWGGFLVHFRPSSRTFLTVGLLLVAVNPYLLSWGVTIKTYAAANLGVLVVYTALARGLATRRPGWFLLVGLGAGLAVGVRLLYLPWAAAVVVVSAIVLLKKPERFRSAKNLVAMLAGLFLMLAPALILFALDPERFLFNNYHYHQLRFSPAETRGFGVALSSLGGALFANPFMVFQLLLAGLGVAWMRGNPESPLRPVLVLSLVGAVLHTLVCLLPDPVYEQYFTAPLSVLLAPMIIVGVMRLGELAPPRLPVPTLVLAAGVVLAIIDLPVRATGIDRAEVWTFDHLERVTQSIEKHSEPNDTVLAFWSGYVFESGRTFLPGMEDHFALGVSEGMSLEDKIRYHVAGKELLLKSFETRYPVVVVLGAWMHEINTTISQKHLPVILGELDSQYEIVEMFGETKILVRKAPPVPAP